MDFQDVSRELHRVSDGFQWEIDQTYIRVSLCEYKLFSKYNKSLLVPLVDSMTKNFLDNVTLVDVPTKLKVLKV